MATLTIGYTFVNATPAVASQVNSNFQDVKTFVEGISAGTNIDAGSIELTKLSNTAIQQLTPSGSIMQYAGTAAPTGWILCDGSAVSTTTYATLYGVIGSAFNTSGGQAAPGAGTFRVPLLTGRIPVGRDASNAAFDVLGETGGSATSVASHTHTDGTLTAATTSSGVVLNGTGSHAHSGSTTEVGNHQHRTPMLAHVGASVAHAHTRDDYYSAAMGNFNAILDNKHTETAGIHQHFINTTFVATGHTITDPNHSHDVTGSTGVASAEATNGNLQPYIVVNYIIKA
jgi:microcystin-dependent protein